jgi:hypothetical protein
MSTTRAAQEGMWVKSLLGELNLQILSIQILQDNQGCIAIAQNPVNHGRTKDIDLRHHYIRELITNGNAKITYCSTEEMVADIFTKALAKGQFEYLRAKLSIAILPSRNSGGYWMSYNELQVKKPNEIIRISRTSPISL